jgi:hypothetical protein
MSPTSRVDSDSIWMTRAAACSTVVVVTHPASAWSRNARRHALARVEWEDTTARAAP